LDSASTPSVPQAAEPGAAPRHLLSLLIRGGGAPNVHVSLVAGGGHGPTSAIAEAGESPPERAEVCVAAGEAANRSGVAPEVAGSECAAPEEGSKRAAPESVLSSRLANKPQVRSKM
jgi:hypothetical protein